MILCIGEILADLIGQIENETIKYSRFPGGAPLNVACGIKKLGGKVGFIGSVGNDTIGKFLLQFCKEMSFNYLDVSFDDEHNTTLAFVEVDEKGERYFSFNRYNTADYHIDYTRLNVIEKFDIIHIGSLMLREDIGYELALKIIEFAQKYNKKISFDVNYRDDIFDSKEIALNRYREIISKSDIIKFSKEEINYFIDCDDYKEGIKRITKDNQMVFVSLGSSGAYFIYKNKELTIPTSKINPVDTTGAGDAFYACILYYLDNMKYYDESYISEIIRRANICGSLACSKKGAISALPNMKELENKYLELYK